MIKYRRVTNLLEASLAEACGKLEFSRLWEVDKRHLEIYLQLQEDRLVVEEDVLVDGWIRWGGPGISVELESAILDEEFAFRIPLPDEI